MKISKYLIETSKIETDIRIAAVSDLHARPYGKVLKAVKTIDPDIILLSGDILEIAAGYMEKRNRNGLDFLKESAQIAPCYYCYGNHEVYYSHAKRYLPKTPDERLCAEYKKMIEEFGVHIVNDRYESVTAECKSSFNKTSFYIGGLVCGRDMDPDLRQSEPNLCFLDDFSNIEGFKILLCHYPHYYEKYMKNTDFDLILSGHAHGGQWRIFGRGVYAPHQGLFPKYTSGIYDGRHIINRGAVNNAPLIPRFFNPCEVLDITIKKI